jgi:hypothetical protein
VAAKQLPGGTEIRPAVRRRTTLTAERRWGCAITLAS